MDEDEDEDEDKDEKKSRIKERIVTAPLNPCQLYMTSDSCGGKTSDRVKSKIISISSAVRLTS